MRKNPLLIDRQTKRANCGPIALANAVAWRKGTRASSFYQAFEPLMIASGYRPGVGVDDVWTSKMLANLDVPFDTVPVRSADLILDALKGGCGVLLAYTWKLEHLRPLRKTKAHLVFIDQTDGAFLNVYNVNGNGAEYVPTLNRYLSETPGRIWVVEKKRKIKVQMPSKEELRVVADRVRVKA